MKRMREILVNQSRLTNILIGMVGLILVLTAIIFHLSIILQNVLLSVGCSLIATSIATWLTSFYLINNNEVKEIINIWKLKGIYETKAEMNIKSNECLESAKNEIDIIAIGMANFLSYKRNLLEKKARNGVKIRIISCDNLTMLKQREKDETISGNGDVIGTMESEVEALTKWVSDVINKEGDVSIKYHSTYPGFSYLRIDDNIFFGPNLPLYKSQSNLALEFNIRGKGGHYLKEYFDSLWSNDNICSKTLNFKS